jgi:hypothetical protein
MIGIIEDTRHGVLVLVVEGEIARADYEAAVAAAARMLEVRDRIDIVEIVHDSARAPLDTCHYDLAARLVPGPGARPFIRRAAVISSPGQSSPIMPMFAPYCLGAIRCFPESGLKEARNWVREPDPD